MDFVEWSVTVTFPFPSAKHTLSLSVSLTHSLFLSEQMSLIFGANFCLLIHILFDIPWRLALADR